MTGEMSRSELTREAWPLHFAIADDTGGQVMPFDQYQGPYIVIGPDIRIGRDPYAYCPRHLGIVRLWVQDYGDGIGVQIYNEANDILSEPVLNTPEECVYGARSVLAGEGYGPEHPSRQND